MKSQSYRDLIAWQKALALVTNIYELTARFPQHELYGLTSQLRRAGVSIVSNIAEGQGRNSTGEFLQFLGHAKGSLVELETQVLIAVNLRYIEASEGDRILDRTNEVARLIAGLMKSLKTPKAKGQSASGS